MSAVPVRMTAILALTLMSGWASPTPPDGKWVVEQALQKLAAAENFSWTAMTIEEIGDKDPKMAETLEGKSAKGGWCQISSPSSKRLSDAFLKDNRIAVLLADGWTIMNVNEAAPEAGKPDKTLRQAQQFVKARSPLEEVKSLLGRVEDLRLRDNGLYCGHYTTLEVPIIIERAQAAGHKIPVLEDPAVRINFRIEDGALLSFELVITGREVKAKKGQVLETLLAMSVDFTNVGTTTFEIPADARKLLE